jgi:hypothetical protein
MVSLGSSCRHRFCPVLAALVGPVQNIFSSPCTISIHLSPSSNKLGRQSCRVARLFTVSLGASTCSHTAIFAAPHPVVAGVKTPPDRCSHRLNHGVGYPNLFGLLCTAVAEIIDPVFAKTSPKRSFSMTEYECFGLFPRKRGSINSGTVYSLAETVRPRNSPRPPAFGFVNIEAI